MTHAVMVAPLQPDTITRLVVSEPDAIGLWYGFSLVGWVGSDGLVHPVAPDCPPPAWTGSVVRAASALASRPDAVA